MKNTSSRCIFDIGSAQDGPILWCMAGTHGNEHEGIWALAHIAEEIQALGIALKGRFLATRGNMAALEVSKRALDIDLNRAWRTKHLQEVQLTDVYSTSEYYEMREILDIVNEVDAKSYSRAVFMDLHSTSAPNGQFAVATDTSPEELLEVLKAPIIYGLNDILHGTMTSFFDSLGYETIGYEGGQIGEEQAKWNIVAAVWEVMVKLGMLTHAQIPIPDQAHNKLGQLMREGVPHKLKLRYHHKVPEGSFFEMKPGFVNFDFIEGDSVLGRDNFGEVTASRDAYLLMPKYQKDGSDGFFLVEEKE